MPLLQGFPWCRIQQFKTMNGSNAFAARVPWIQRGIYAFAARVPLMYDDSNYECVCQKLLTIQSCF